MLLIDGDSNEKNKGELFKNLELSLQVESEGFEPSSKRRAIKLSTCLFFDWIFDIISDKDTQ